MKHALIRWALYFTVSLPVQLLVYLLYPIAIIIFRKKWKNKHGVKLQVPAENGKSVVNIIDNGNLDGMRDEVYLDHSDNHNALLHVGLWSYKPNFVAREGLRRLVRPDGGLKRKHPVDEGPPVSRDCLAAWVYAYTLYGGPKEELRKVLKHYFKYAFGFTHYDTGKVSTRSSASGLNYAYDGYKKLSQPAFGPAYYNTAALLALASKELGFMWSLAYWAHYIVMGGWLWWMEPIIYNDKNLIYYDHHITAISLASILHNKPSKDVAYALRRVVTEISPSGNVDGFFYGIAWNAGVLTKEEQQKGLRVITHLSNLWPQVPPLSEEYYNGKTVPERHSMLGFHTKLLMNKPLSNWR